MQENGRHILLRGLNELPLHKASPGLWERIEVMKLDVPTDLLPVHKPDASSWDAVLAGIARKTIPLRKVYLSMALLAIILLGGGIGYYQYLNNSPENPATANNAKAIPVKGDEDDEITVTHFQNDVPDKVSVDDNREAVIEPVNEAGETAKEDDINTKRVSTIPAPETKDISIQGYEQFYLAILNKKDPGYLSITQTMHNQPSNAKRTKRDPSFDCGYNRNEHSFFISPGFEFQALLNSGMPANTTSKYWYTFDLRIMYKLNRFRIEAGLGAGMAKDNTQVGYSYLSNEIIYSYVYVDSIYYDTVTGTTQFFTTTVDVYDSVPHSGTMSIQKKYSYLSIPVDIGIDIIQKRKFSMGISAGITYYHEMNYKEVYPVINHENSRITSVKTDDCFRRKEFFRLSGSIDFSYILNDRLQLSARPGFQYFINGIYENSDNLNDIRGVGIRLGIVYKF